MNQSEYLEFTRTYKKILKKEKLIGFGIHILAYVVVNTSLFIAYIESSPVTFWGCLLGWGSGVLAIVIFKIIPIDKNLDAQLTQAEEVSGFIKK
jgi:hypothetical protein